MFAKIFSRFFSSGLRWLWITVLVLALDRISKVFIQKNMLLYESRMVFPHVNFTLAYNKGAAFSFLNSASGWQSWIFGGMAVIISAILVVWMKKLSAKQAGLAIASALIIGGALGNLWDRISYGHVIDFIDVYVSNWHWPVFNLADSAICLGALIMLGANREQQRGQI